MGKMIRGLRSMRFAIVILLLLGIGSALGTFLPQNEPQEFYINQYGEPFGTFLIGTGMDRVFSTLWFAALVILLCLSLFFCVVLRWKSLFQRIKSQGLRKNQMALGSWLLHVGILWTILFFAVGNATAYTGMIRNVPGTVTPVKDTHLSIAIDDFSMELRGDGSVDSYITSARVLDDTGLREEGLIRVNHPITVDGYQFSQSATGFAVTAHIERQGTGIGDAILFQGEYVTADQDALVLTLLNLYPDYVETAEGPATRSMEMKQPYALYRLYYNGQDMGARIQPVHAPVTVGEYRFVFADPVFYSGLSVRKDSFAPLTGVGAGLLLVGIALVFVAPQKEKEESDE